MRIDEFGCENKQIVVMIHGLAMSWRMFWPSIGLLARNFHVLAVTVPGHDQADGSEFTSVEEIAAGWRTSCWAGVFATYSVSMACPWAGRWPCECWRTTASTFSMPLSTAVSPPMNCHGS